MFGNMLYKHPCGNPFVTRLAGYDSSRGESVRASAHLYSDSPRSIMHPEVSSSNVPIADSTRRYIECLEVEVQELTRQYEVASQLLYHAVFAQEATNTIVDENTTRMSIVELECTERGKIAQFILSMALACNRTRSIPIEQTNMVVLNSPHESRELSHQIACALSDSLKMQNQHIAQLVESVPYRVCSALTASDARRSKQPDVPEIIQSSEMESQTGQRQLECARNQAGNVGTCLDQNVIYSTSGPDESGERVITLKQAVRSLENTSQCLVVEVLLRTVQKNSPVEQECAPLPSLGAKTLTAAPFTVEHPRPVVSKDLQLLSMFTQRAFNVLQSMIFEYGSTLEQMQLITEEEMNSLNIVNERKRSTRWNSLLEEKEALIYQSKRELEKLQNQHSWGNKENKKEGVLPISQLYAQYAGPFIPPNMRNSKKIKPQSIWDLRRDAICVGARPASFSAPPAGQMRMTLQNQLSDNASRKSDESSRMASMTLSTSAVADTVLVPAVSQAPDVVPPTVRIASEKEIPPKSPPSERGEAQVPIARVPLTQGAAVLPKALPEAPGNVSPIGANIRTFKQPSSSSSSSSSLSTTSKPSAPLVKQDKTYQPSIPSQGTLDVRRVTQEDLRSQPISNIEAVSASPGSVVGKSDVHESDAIKKSTSAADKSSCRSQTIIETSYKNPPRRILSHNSFDDSTESESHNGSNLRSIVIPMPLKGEEPKCNVDGSNTSVSILDPRSMLRERQVGEISTSLDTSLTLSLIERGDGRPIQKKDESEKPLAVNKTSVRKVHNSSFDDDESSDASYRTKTKQKPSGDKAAADHASKLQRISFQR